VPGTKRAIEPLYFGDHLSLREFERRWTAMPELKKAELIDGMVYVAHDMPVLPDFKLPFENGDHLTLSQFMRLYEGVPELKKAELIEGMVFMAPLGMDHGEADVAIAGLLYNYCAHTPGCEAGSNVTWKMSGAAPQPDSHLRIIEECGGQSRVEGKHKYGLGAPELLVEVCHSSVAYDLRQKKSLYFNSGVIEYVTIQLHDRKIQWFVRSESEFASMEPTKPGVFRSRVFPGFWLNSRALFANQKLQLFKTLNAGIESAEHAAFVKTLAAMKKKPKGRTK